MNQLFTTLTSIACLNWQRALQDLRVVKSILTKVLCFIFDGLTKEDCIAIVRGTG